MKYAKQWKEDINKLPITLRDQCINYKLWKKKLHRDILIYDNTLHIENVMNLYIDELSHVCKNIDILFNKIYNIKTIYKNIPIFKNMYKDVHVEDLQKFARVNTRSLYKITKKISKIYGISNVRSWMIECCKIHRYSFLGSEVTRHLELLSFHANDNIIECPICFCEKTLQSTQSTEKTQHPFLILPCGHNACLECVLKQAQVYGKKGTWFNLLASADMRLCKCPICRLPQAFQATRHIKYLK